MINKIKNFLITLSLLILFFPEKSFGLIEVDITRGNLDPLPIAVSPLHVDVKSENFEGVKIKELGANEVIPLFLMDAVYDDEEQLNEYLKLVLESI